MTDPNPSTSPQPTPVVETLRPVAHLQLKAMALLLFTLALIVGSGLYLLYARGMRLDLPDAQGAPVPQVACPIQLSATPVVYHAAPPALGQHTEAVLMSLGKTAEEVARLRENGVV